MNDPRARYCALVGLGLLFLLGLPPARAWLEATMTAHMLIQMPLLAAAGFALGRAFTRPQRAALCHLVGGAAPYVLVALFASSYWMLPRALDAALVDPLAAVAKFISLPLLVGMPLAFAWGRLGMVGRGFVWTNFFSMLVVLGWLYIAAPVRVCNSYLVADQYEAGWWMIRLAIALFLAWLALLLAGHAPTGAHPALSGPSASPARAAP